MGRVRRRLVRVRTEGTVRRRPGDWARVVVAAGTVGLLSVHANHPSRTERAVVAFFDSLPRHAGTFFLLLYNLVALWALGLVVVAALLLRRRRLARDLALAGVTAWLVGRLLAFWIGRGSLTAALQVVFDPTDPPRFPLVRVAAAVAIVTVASPHLTRPGRRVGQTLVVVLALSAMYLGRGGPFDLLGAVVLGWGIAAAVHLGFGTADRRPSLAEASEALRVLQIQFHDLRPARSQPAGRAIFVAENCDGPLQMVALGRDEADAQFLARAWRFVTLRDVTPTLFPTRRQQVEYEAYITLLAHDAGARVPRMLGAATVGSLAVLVQQMPKGVALADAEREDVDDVVLANAWCQLRRLHRARIAHGRLDADHVVVGSHDAALVGFECASTTPGSWQRGADVAQLMAATAPVVGTTRTVEAAVRGVGVEAVAGAIPVLQPAALPDVTKRALDDAGDVDATLEQLREVAGAATQTPPTELRRLYRVAPRSLFMAIGALVGLGVLLSRIGDPATFWASIHDAHWAFVALALLFALLADVAFALAFLGTTPIRVSPWAAVELQASLSFLNLAVPVGADTMVQVRFLQKSGLDTSSSVATGGVLSMVTETTVQIGLFVIALWLAPDKISLGRIDTRKMVVIALGAVLALLVATTAVSSVRRLRLAVIPRVTKAAHAVWDAIRSPWRITLVIAGNVGAQVLYAASILACLHAFGASVNFWTVLALNIGVSTIASLVPVPGGGNALSVIGLAGVLVSLGVSTTAATAAVLVHQVVANYLPAIPGWLAIHDLARRRLL